jgi:hypothetical protein
MSTAMASSSTNLRVRAPFSGAQQLRRSANTARPRIAVTPMAIGGGKPGSRAEETRDRASDDNPAENAAKDFEKNVVDPFVKKTQENSGLDANAFNQTADSASKDDVGAFADTMSFAGLAPEIINGRGAMIGMLAALGAEVRTHEPILRQIQTAPVLVLGTFGLIILASIIPIARGADLARKGAGPFTPRAEVWNGRLAMVSFATLVLVETWKAGPGLVP